MTKISKKIGKMWKDMTGVSPIIAVILMVAITVVLAATIYVWVSGFGGGGGTSASLNLQQTSYDSGTVTYKVLTAKGGLGWEDIKITVGGTTVWNAGKVDAEFSSSGQVNITSPGSTIETNELSGKISAGDTIEITGSGVVDHGKTVTVFDINSDTPIWSATIHY